MGLALLLATLVSAAAPARADFTQATLVSGTAQLQFDQASAPALSTDGRYVVFQGSLVGVPGVYRRDLQTGQVTQVAGGDAADLANACNAGVHPLAACDAAAPSVSADGRYVAFTTTADLEPATSEGQPGEPASDAGCPEVYVRDMEVEPNVPGAYTLASALGSGRGIVYAGGCPAPSPMGFAVAGAQAAPGVALSADGRHVAFTVLGPSDLDAGAECVAPEYKHCTPPSQVAVRDLQAQTTTLVTVTPGGQATPEGGAFPSTYSEAHSLRPLLVGSGAAISADASTVAWLGTNVPAQVSGATDVEEHARNGPGAEVEPLWRRIADGPGAVTKRLLNGAGTDFYPSYVEPNEAVVSGTLVRTNYFVAPALSWNGQTVATISDAPSPAAEVTLIELRVPTTEGYVVHVDDSSAPPTVVHLTETTDYAVAPAALGPVENIAISPDGSRVAFDTNRTQFDLPSLALVSPPSTFTGITETYEADLRRGTLERVTSTYNGSEPNGKAGLLSFAGDGQTLAFDSEATNLFFGDAAPTSQVYLVHELPSSSQVTPQQIGAMPALAAAGSYWLLSATAVPEPDGSVLVDAQVPGAGRLTVRAGAQVPAMAPRSARSSRRARSGRLARSAARRRGSRSGGALPARTVARGAIAAGMSSDVHLRLRVSPLYRAAVTSRRGLYAVLRVTFAAPHHRALVQEIPVVFHRTARKAHARKAHARKTTRSKTTRKAATSGKHGIGR
jgi:Tol biopolymer transport system component